MPMINPIGSQRKLHTQGRQRVHRIRRSFTLEFPIIYNKAMLPFSGDTYHLETQRRVCMRFAAVRRIPAGHESHFVESQCLQHFEGRAQVSVMNRIERAAEHSHRAHSACTVMPPACREQRFQG